MLSPYTMLLPYMMLSPRIKRATLHERKQNRIRVFLRGLVRILKESIRTTDPCRVKDIPMKMQDTVEKRQYLADICISAPLCYNNCKKLSYYDSIGSYE